MKGARNIISVLAGALHQTRHSAGNDSFAEIASAQAALEQSCRDSTQAGYDYPATWLEDGRIALTLDVRNSMRRTRLQTTA